ncbi:MAG: hypothetical protein KAG97_02160, partial [Victivallales bacterium]|nr:hypothetical protein [Victivallales bacterium]
LPLTLRVLDYKLKRDPAKRYSVYYSFPPYQSIAPESPKWDKARENEFKAMLSYGIDMFPTVRLRTRMLKNGEVEVYIREERNVDKMVEMGFKGPIPVTGGMWHFYHNNTKGGKILSHWRITKKPKGNAIYKSIERSFRKLREKARKKGWPELICCPMDEVSPTTADFASKVFAAIRRSGMKTYATKDPTSSDAAAYRKLDAVYAWCSQPFGFIYDKVTADKNHEYWIYPNHNAGEIKNRVVMQKGGRMTYGFGLWKSGYTTVIPWHWRWITDKKQHFNYMSGRGLSGCGARVDDKLQVIPAVYWECFREGYDDLRYLYTLQDAIVKREGSENKQCRTLVDQGKKLVQKIWNSIPVKKKYLNVQKWTDENFQVRRWQIASLTQKLLAYPTTNDKAPLSVPDFVRESQTASKVVKKDVLTLGLKNGWIDIFNLGDGDYKHWRAVNKEASKKVTSGNPATLQFKVDVDHKIDGGGEKGKYPIGWPRISRVFKKGALDLTKYDYLSFKVKVDSDRSEVEDDVTPFIINFASYAKGVRYDLKLDFGDKPRVWLSEKLSIADMISKSGFPKHDWCDLRIIQLVIAENFYADKTKLVFDFRNLALLKFNRPILKSIICGAVLLNSDKNIVVRVDGYGLGSAEKRGDSLVITVKDSNGKKVHSDTTLFKQDALFVFDASKLNIGTLKLELSIIDSLGKSISSISKKIEVIKGF